MSAKIASPEEVKLDAYEQAIEENFEKLKSYPKKKEKEIRQLLEEAARNFNEHKKDTRVAIRIHSTDLESIKSQAAEKGLRYQTYLSSLIHQAAIGRIKV